MRTACGWPGSISRVRAARGNLSLDMRWTLILLVALPLLAYACSSEEKVTPEERAAAELVNTHLRDSSPKSYIAPRTQINLDKHKSDCTIGQGSTTGVEPMAAKCEWSVRQEDASTLVELVEKWKCSEFNKRAGRDDFCQKDEGSHRWSWQITGGKDVQFLTDVGDAAPESFYLPTG